MVEDCVFCRIVAGKQPAEIIFQDQELTVFNDQFPASSVHVLIVPNRHINSLNEVADADALLLGRMLLKAKELAAQFGVSETGYRLLINTGEGGGQSVFHLHLHLIGGPHKLAIHS
jgi:histidine triad (HIT) family protein